MTQARQSFWVTLAVLAIVLVGCGDDGDPGPGAAPDQSSDDTSSGESPDGSASDPDDGQPDDGTGVPSSDAVPPPVAKYTAHGPDAATTVAPPCGRGNVDKGGDLFRVTPPDGFEWSGTSGGSGRDEITFRDADGAELVFIEAVTRSELGLVADWEVVGPTGTEIVIDGDSIPVMEVVAEGSTAYALVELPYLGPLPVLPDGEARGTAIVTSADEGHPTLEEAVGMLETVRVERCAAMSQAIIWAPAAGVAPVPVFDPDPLGKTRPDEPQPAIQGLPSLNAYSLEQLAYLMPVDEARAACAAATVAAAWVDDPLGYLKALSPTGTFQEEFDTIIADC